ncbi:MAG: flagellar biosynthesis anti-sigma factor FlgM [Acidobacteria bacterium]|nr:flagellar biosynthesis anti-sigma factor FlgM [Acidobacteriota bacterium]
MRINDANPLGPGGAGGIGGTGGAGAAAGAGKAGQANKAGRATDAALVGKSEDGDRFQLSGLGQALRSEDLGGPERQARVEQLRAEVKSGKYHPDASEVSKSIVQDALNFPGGSESGGGGRSGGEK